MIKRRHPRLKEYDYSSDGAYFITICTKERRNYFWKNVGAAIGRPQDVELSEYGKIVDKAINNIPDIYPCVIVDYYVVMPDHVHLLLFIVNEKNGRPMAAPTISRVVNQFKGYATKMMGTSVWQKLYYDHIIRNSKDYEEHIKYICENPIRWNTDELYVDEQVR